MIEIFEGVIGALASFLLSLLSLKVAAVGIIVAMLSLLSLFLIYERIIRKNDNLPLLPYEEFIFDLAIISSFLGTLLWEQMGYLATFVFLPSFLVGYYSVKIFYRWLINREIETKGDSFVYGQYLVLLIFFSVIIYLFLLETLAHYKSLMLARKFTGNILTLVFSSLMSSLPNAFSIISKAFYNALLATLAFMIGVAVGIVSIKFLLKKKIKKVQYIIRKVLLFLLLLAFMGFILVSISFFVAPLLSLEISTFKNQVIIYNIRTQSNESYLLVYNKLGIPIRLLCSNTPGKFDIQYLIEENSKCKIKNLVCKEGIYIWSRQLPLHIYYDISENLAISNSNVLEKFPDC